MQHEDNPKSIKYYVKRYLQQNTSYFKGKTIIDFPAGNGVTSRIVKEIGAIPIALDLFPEYFEVDGISCQRANIKEGLPLKNHSADAFICQEGIEHFSDQFESLKEFNRILKPGGLLLVTTPNYSNLQSKLSYLLTESERFGSIMAPNELDSIWVSKQEITDEIYFGHIFLIGIQKLRVLARLSGFRLKKVHFTRSRKTSLFLLTNWLIYKKRMRKNNLHQYDIKKQVYSELFRLGINIKILLGADLMVEFIKEKEASDVSHSLTGVKSGTTKNGKRML